MLKKLPYIDADNIKVNDDVQKLLLNKVLPFEIFTKVCRDFIKYIGRSKTEKSEILKILNNQHDAYDVVYKININNKRWINLYFIMRYKNNKVIVIVTTYEMYIDFLKLTNSSGEDCIPFDTITMLFKEKGVSA